MDRLGMASRNDQLDSRIEVVTPENIAFQYRVAGPFRRLPAFLVDTLIRVAVVVVMAIVFAMIFGSVGASGMADALTLVLWFVISWFYGGLFETFWNGQTPGKRMMGIRVLSVDGQPINGLQAVLRNILREVDAMPVVPVPFAMFGEEMVQGIVPLYMLGLIAALCNDRYQRLGDLACGTMVVVEETHAVYGVARVTDPEAVRLAANLPPNVKVSRGLARALSDYVQRRVGFGAARRLEIARHLAQPLLVKLNLPSDINHDLLLCALYQRTFIADREEEPGFDRGRPTYLQPPPMMVGQ